MNALPELWKNRERYELREAVDLWAYAFADVPLNQTNRQRVAFRDAYRAAEQELRQAGIVRPEEYRYSARVSYPLHPSGVSWMQGGPPQGTRIVNEEKTGTREFIRGEDLAKLATDKGRPGLFGFEADKPTSTMREDAKENLLVLIGILAEMLADKSGPSFRKADGGLNKNSLHAAMKKHAESKGLSSAPVGKTQFSDLLNEAFRLLR